MRGLYTILKARLDDRAVCPSIKHVRLFNDQFNKSNDDNSDKDIEQAFPYPCAFIEFPSDNPQTSSGFGAKRLQVLIRIHIGFLSYKFEDLAMFDVALEVQQALENYITDGITPFTYKGQQMDSNHDNVYIYTFDFETQWSDESLFTKRNDIAAPSPLTLETNADLDIDNIIIRTGDGVI